jgi:hypothetical protein
MEGKDGPLLPLRQVDDVDGTDAFSGPHLVPKANGSDQFDPLIVLG